MNNRYTLDNLGNLGASAQVQIRAALQGKMIEVVPEPASTPRALQPMKSALRQNKKGPNRTELAFQTYLKGLYPGQDVDHEPMVLRLANGLRFKPDFAIWDGDECVIYEVKGFMREDAAAKIKMAASKFPWMQFKLAFKRKNKQGGGWDIQLVYP